jgi:hypothetical protein
MIFSFSSSRPMPASGGGLKKINITRGILHQILANALFPM